jgi:hypothetical protein
MTTKLSVRYEKSTVHEDPKIFVRLHVPALLCLKALWFAVFGKGQAFEHALTEEEVEVLAKAIVRWRIVRKLRSAKKK